MANDIVVSDHSNAVMIETTREKYEIIESDLNEIQNNLTSSIDKMKDKIPVMLEFMEAAQNDKMYTAVAKVLQTYAILNKTAADIVKQKQDLYDGFRKTSNTKDDPPSVINNDNRTIAFHGTATELLDQVLGKKNESS